MDDVVTTSLSDEMLREIALLSTEKKMDRATLLRNLIGKGLAFERKERVLRLYKDKKISLEKAASVLGVDIVEMIEIIQKEELYIDYGLDELKEDLRGIKNEGRE